jgi:adenine-specific DNA-methyltransferase
MNFKDSYSRDELLTFIKDLIPEFTEDIRPVNLNDGFHAVKKANLLGNSDAIELSVFELKIEGKAEKKVYQAKEGFKLMQAHQVYRALAIYFSDEDQNWRLSLMQMTPEKSDTGRITHKFTNPKRYSFYLGPQAKVKTPEKFLINKGGIKDFEDLLSRFSVEVVNKEFFQEISGAFTKLVGGTTSKGKTKTTHEALLHLPSVVDASQTSLEFAVRLIGRLIFCWFLREKRSESGLALMPKELLSDKATAEHHDYYHKILEPIFFEILNKPIKSRRDEFAIEPFSTIPYLNGGLFSPQEDDYYKLLNGDLQSRFHNTLVIPDNWFKELFEVLETYNFTIDENTSFDEELSIDPEMLGRIFENLLAEINPETGESARKSTGSYYTPRVIVDYMVDESLCLYLKEKTNIDEEKLRPLISYDLEDDLINQLSDDDRSKIADALSSVKILDPACGSGAFPIGALQKIVFMLQQIDPHGQLWFKKQIQNTPIELRRVIKREFQEKNFDYLRKLGIIRENIYGVDIQPIATEISRLRCFLTLVVDERIDESLKDRGIEPLPNLDFKFVTANSLIGLPKIDQPQQSMFDDQQKIDDLKMIINEYFNADLIDREKLKVEFANKKLDIFKALENEHGWVGVSRANLTRQLIDWDPFSHKSTTWFEPEWMFGIKDGFDIVIANPPYVRADNPDFKDQRGAIISCKQYVSLYERWDLYIPFIEKGLQLLNTHGKLAFITSNSLCSSKFAYKLIDLIQEKYFTVFIDYFEDNIKVFDAGVVPVVFGISSSKINIDVRKRTHDVEFDNISKLENVEINKFKLMGHEGYRKNVIKHTISAQSVALGDICYISYGLRPNSDERRWKGEFKRNDLVSGIKDEVHSARYVEGKNLSDYRVNKVLYLEWNTERCPGKLVRPTFPELYNRPKILCGTMVGGTYDDSGLICNHSLVAMVRFSDLSEVENRSIQNSIAKFNNIARNELETISKEFNLKYILSILNSVFAKEYLNNIRRHRLENYFYPDDFRKLPIAEITADRQQPFTEIVDKILLITKSPDYLDNQVKQVQVMDLEHQIDRMVFKLYDLSSEII